MSTLLDGLQHYWPMDEGAGTTVADVIGGKHGTLVGMDDTNWVSDGPGGTNAVHIKAANQYIDIDPSLILTAVDSEYSIGGWTWFESFSLAQYPTVITLKTSLSGSEAGFLTYSNQGVYMRLFFAMVGVAVARADGDPAELVQQWRNTGYSFDDKLSSQNKMMPYFDGVAQAVTGSGTWSSQGYQNRISGSIHGGSYHYFGKLNRFAAWNRVLTPAEWLEFFTTGIPVGPPAASPLMALPMGKAF